MTIHDKTRMGNSHEQRVELLECWEINARCVGAFDAGAIGFVKHPGGKLLNGELRQIKATATVIHTVIVLAYAEQMNLASKPGMFGIPNLQGIAAVRIMSALCKRRGFP